MCFGSKPPTVLRLVQARGSSCYYYMQLLKKITMLFANRS